MKRQSHDKRLISQASSARRESIYAKNPGVTIVKGLECPYKECIHSESLEAEADNAAALIAMEEERV